MCVDDMVHEMVREVKTCTEIKKKNQEKEDRIYDDGMKIAKEK